MTRSFQLSLRELQGLVVFSAVGIAALMQGGILTSILLSIAIVVATAFAIVACIAHGNLRTVAIGFLVPVIVYAAMLQALGPLELDPYEGRLPTTKLMLPVFELVAKHEYRDLSSGEILYRYDPAKYGRSNGGFGASTVAVHESPDRMHFMSSAHVLFAMMCGYCGAKFALWIAQRQQPTVRNNDPQSAPPKLPIAP